MEGNIVKAAWILSGALLLSVVLAGTCLLLGGLYFMHSSEREFEILSKRSAQAILDAPKNTHVSVSGGDGTPVKVGFDPKLPMALRAENSLDDSTGKRASFEVDVKPNLSK